MLEQLTLNFTSSKALEDVFARMARRYYVSKWASRALQGRDAVQRCVRAPPPCPPPSRARALRVLTVVSPARPPFPAGSST